jgi:hypothetical protein
VSNPEDSVWAEWHAPGYRSDESCRVGHGVGSHAGHVAGNRLRAWQPQLADEVVPSHRDKYPRQQFSTHGVGPESWTTVRFRYV